MGATSRKNDVIVGRAGNDSIDGVADQDLICGSRATIAFPVRAFLMRCTAL
jgi:hypothetical protein